jgi:hypothetical protein
MRNHKKSLYLFVLIPFNAHPYCSHHPQGTM